MVRDEEIKRLEDEMSRLQKEKRKLLAEQKKEKYIESHTKKMMDDLYTRLNEKQVDCNVLSDDLEDVQSAFEYFNSQRYDNAKSAGREDKTYVDYLLGEKLRETADMMGGRERTYSENMKKLVSVLLDIIPKTIS